MVEQATKDIAGRKTECTQEEGGEHQNFFSIGRRDVLPFGRPPLEHRVIW
jgi:hypothetical protein